jgi:predicted nucleic acid-binding Zn ribbon protein
VPFYEYRRPDGTTFEILQKMSDHPLTHDPETGVPVDRVFHPIAVHFKGKGFYNTDYGTRKRNAEKAASGEGGGSADGAKGGDGAKAGSSSSSGESSSSSSGGASSSSSGGSSAGSSSSSSDPG